MTRSVAALADAAPGCRVEGVAAGLKALVRLPDGCDEDDVVAALARAGVVVLGVRDFRVGRTPAPDGAALVINFSRPPSHRYRDDLARLVAALARAMPR